MNVPVIILCVLVALGLIVLVLDALPWGTESYTLSTRELPNIAPEMAETSAGNWVAPRTGATS